MSPVQITFLLAIPALAATGCATRVTYRDSQGREFTAILPKDTSASYIKGGWDPEKGPYFEAYNYNAKASPVIKAGGEAAQKTFEGVSKLPLTYLK